MAKKTTKRSDELSTRPRMHERLVELRREIEQGFHDQRGRADRQVDYWEAYNCVLNQNQYYNGNSQIFVPIIQNAVNARKVRFVNQIFPRAGRYVEVIDQEGEQPAELMALAEHYVRVARLRQLAAALEKNGDIEGQYNVYVGWRRRRRDVVWTETRPVSIDGIETDDAEEVEDIHEETIFDEHPYVEVLHDTDVLIWPVTADSVEDAIEKGGGVAIVRRWSRTRLKEMAEGGEIVDDIADTIDRRMRRYDGNARADLAKELASHMGIREKGKSYQGVEAWVKLKVDGARRLCRVYFGGEAERVLGCKLSPFWNDRAPVISCPVEMLAGVAKGDSKLDPCLKLQYMANDAANEGMDSAAYALLPIIMTDPQKNPRTGSMILDLAAVWETDPQSTQFARFPALWKDAFEIIGAAKTEIFQTLSVNPAMLPQQTGTKRKMNQAEIANEQQVDLLTTADVVTMQEDGIWTPIVQRFMEYDAQFRTMAISIRAYGEAGMRAKLQQVKPLQMGKRYEFRWFGVEQARNAAQVQQQIAAANVLRGIPPNLMPGKRLDLSVLAERIAMSVMGPRDAHLILKDITADLSLDPELENAMLLDDFGLPVSPFDDDAAHIEAHLGAARAATDQAVKNRFKAHILRHQMQMQAKAQQAAGAQQPGVPGTPAGAAPRGLPGAGPRPGAQPAGPRLLRGPNGLIRPEAMPAAGAVGMPRRM